MDLVSVIIPVYNVEPYLLRCVESVQNQSYKNLEIILVDDGSPDNCPKLCDELALKDDRIKVIHKENGGLGYARNSGLDVATGDYVMFIDSDDWISDTRVENLYNALTEHNADIAIGTYTDISSDGKTSVLDIEVDAKVYEGDEVVQQLLLPMIGSDTAYPHDMHFNCCAWRSLYKMDVIKKNDLRFLSERVAVSEDMYFNVDFYAHTDKAVVTDDEGYFYFKNYDSISRRYDPKGIERTIKFYTQLYSQLEHYSLKDKVEYRVDRTFLMKMRTELMRVVTSDLPKKEKLRIIEEVLNIKTMEEVLSTYPIDTYVSSIRIFSKLMKNKKVRSVYRLIKLRESAQGQGLMKKALKLIGIGK